MNDDNLTDLLEARVAGVPVGPPPLAAIRRAAARRRRSYGAALAAAAAVVVTVGAVAVWSGSSGSRGDDGPVASDSASASSDVPPAGFRWVGVGRAAIAVPESWPDNDTRCGTPVSDTVIVDQGVVELCATAYPAGVTSVEIRAKNGVDDLLDWVPTEVDGEEALRSPTVAGEAYDVTTVYRTSLYLPARDVMFVAASSVSAAAAEELLTRVTILDTLVAVPGISPANYETADQSEAGETYVRTLEETGLVAEVVTKPNRGGPGFVLGVSPAPGTVVEPGTVVTVTVAD